jgi:hypothetical protein
MLGGAATGRAACALIHAATALALNFIVAPDHGDTMGHLEHVRPTRQPFLLQKTFKYFRGGNGDFEMTEPAPNDSAL